jgi:hypothetical protein
MTNNPDRMRPLGTLPDLDFSTETPSRNDVEAFRDYSHVLIPSARLDLAGIRAARELLDDAEREILAYRFRLFEDDADWTGWDIDIPRCKVWLASFGDAYDCDDLTKVDWLKLSRHLEAMRPWGGYGELRDLVALLMSDKTPAEATS